MAPPVDKSQDTSQFNAWLSNLAPFKGAAKPTPKPSSPESKPMPSQTAKGGGLLGSVDEELDDIFGRITISETDTPSPAQVQAAEVAPPRPRPLSDIPRPSVPPQPSPSGPPQPPISGPMLVRTLPPHSPPQVELPRSLTPSPTARTQEMAVPRPAASQPPPPTVSEKEIQAMIDRAVAEAKATMQAQIRDLQAKYQGQRQKWERLLSDLRNRNDDLHRQNLALEEELASLRERHRLLLQELSQRPIVGPSEMAPTSELREPEVLGSPPPMPVLPETEINIGFSLTQSQPQPEMLEARPALEIEPVIDEPMAGGEADDLLAELEALEQEMKNMGGEG